MTIYFKIAHIIFLNSVKELQALTNRTMDINADGSAWRIFEIFLWFIVNDIHVMISEKCSWHSFLMLLSALISKLFRS